MLAPAIEGHEILTIGHDFVPMVLVVDPASDPGPDLAAGVESMEIDVFVFQ
jgi:hypothetical protein